MRNDAQRTVVISAAFPAGRRAVSRWRNSTSKQTGVGQAALSTIGDDEHDGTGVIFRVSLNTVPEPTTLLLPGFGALVLFTVRRRR